MTDILVIEDNEGDQFLTRILILSELPGAKVHQARDGMEALEFLRTTDVKLCLILLDINMPRMNGHEFLKEYSIMTKGEIPVVAMLTSSSQKMDMDEAYHHKCVKDYLLKPLDAQKVRKLIEIFNQLKNNPTPA